jgi:restriction system protein
MAIPDYQTVMLPLLKCVANGAVHVQELTRQLCEHFHLTDDERRQLLPSGHGVTVIHSRVGWAKTYLKQAGLVSQPRRGVVELTQRGSNLLRTNPETVNDEVLSRYPEFRAFKVRSRSEAKPDEPDPPRTKVGPAVTPAGSPDEQIDGLAGELEADLRSTLLSRIVASSPEFFEQLIVDLILAMGYGGSRADAGERIGRSGDGGLDGVIREDRLGLDQLYLQAKRYQPGNRIGVDAVRSFAGALNDVGAQKGVFITTSSFSPEAIAYAIRQQTKRIVLIDGERLTRLMVQFNIGVRLQRVVEIKRIDLEYFDGLDAV